MKVRLLSLSLCLALLTGACANKKVPSVHDYYSQGEYFYDRGVYKGAIENYQRLVDQYPFSPLAEQAELKIGLTYYTMHDYPEAISALSDFVRMHPMNKELPLASYYLGMSYFDQMHGPAQDQSNTKSAMEQFRLLEAHYPESAFAELAHQRIEVCRQVLAGNEYMIGSYYAKQANFPAAESRYAELMEMYPETPVAPKGLYDLAETLKKEGKKYSAAQAFAAIKADYGKTKYAALADKELKQLNQPVDTEEDPLRLVLAESGFGPPQDEPPLITVSHHERDGMSAGAAPVAGGAALTPAVADNGPPVTLRGIRLASSPKPISIIFDLSGPVKFQKHFEGGPDFSTLTVRMLNTQPDSKLDQHMVFDRSIFRDSDIKSDGTSTTVVVNTTHVARFAIIPLEEPSRLLITFTSDETDLGQAGDQTTDSQEGDASSDQP
ncbi:MAG TPA: outer membrane protein assembly factor BamD [Candidatus Binataceae bacterium]|nr:outer membrane protein assembly factor BamD [Candidatus Binataceae bacterium]